MTNLPIAGKLRSAKLFDWGNWSIRTRLILIAVVPVVYLFLALVSYSYYARLNEVREELDARAKTIATTLADGVEYNIATENIPAVKQMIYGVTQSDRSIYRIDIFDTNRRELTHVENSRNATPASQFIEMPIKHQIFWVILVPDEPSTYKNKAQSKSADEKKEDILGYVRVTMTPTYLLDTQKRRFIIELLTSILALMVSAWLVWFLSASLTRPLRLCIDALREIRAGDTRTQIEVSTGGEIGELQSSINEMAQSMHSSQLDLENKIAVRTKELVFSRNEAIKADAEKRRLIHKVNSIVEAERQSIAVEIHDELNASLIAVRLESERIARIAGKAQHDDQHTADFIEIEERAKAVIKLALGLYANGRNLVRRLRPEVLELMGLQGAIEEMIRVYNNAQNACSFEFISEGDFAHLNSDLAISVYRVIQEAISNIVKHAEAKTVNIALNMNAEKTNLSISIVDDGVGFNPNEKVAGIGITGMRERVLVLDGVFSLESNIGKGTTISIVLPVSA